MRINEDTVRRAERKPNQVQSLFMDESLPGFGLVVGAQSKTFVVKLTKGNSTLKKKLGTWPALKAEDARRLARKELGNIEARADEVVVTSGWTLNRAFEHMLTAKERAPRTVRDHRDYFRRHLETWADRDLRRIKTQEVTDLLRSIKSKREANGARGTLVAIWSCLPDGTNIPSPVSKLNARPHRLKECEDALPTRELAHWFRDLKRCTPVRRLAHEFTLLSGLRPANVCGLRSEWVQLDRQRIIFPAGEMKNREPFLFPLSARMAEIIKDAQAAAQWERPGSAFVFTSRRNPTGCIGSLEENWKPEKPYEIDMGDGSIKPYELFPYNYVLRRTFGSIAQTVVPNSLLVELLMAHKLPAVQRAYYKAAQMFPTLLEHQERISAEILKLGAQSP